MSGIPEYRPSGGEAAAEQPTIRRIAGILALIAGVMLFIGFLSASITVFAAGALVLSFTGLEATMVLLVIAIIIAGIMGIVLAAYSLAAGLAARTGNPAPLAKPPTFMWAVLSILASILILISLVMREASSGYEIPVMILVGSVLVLVGVALVKPGASLGAWLAGSIIIAVAIIIFMIVSVMEDVVEGPSKYRHLTATLSLLDVTVLLGGLIGAVALIVAPFLGRARLWIAEIIALVGVIVSLASIAYKAGIGAIFALILGGLGLLMPSKMTLTTLAAVTGLVAGIFLTIGAALGIAAAVLGIIYLAMEKPGASSE